MGQVARMGDPAQLGLFTATSFTMSNFMHYPLSQLDGPPPPPPNREFGFWGETKQSKQRRQKWWALMAAAHTLPIIIVFLKIIYNKIFNYIQREL